MTTELVTQIIILATALVGLYKAANYKSKAGESMAEHKKTDTPLHLAFTGILSYLGFFGFMLAMPAFVWAFTWITSHTPKKEAKYNTEQYSIPYQIPSNPSNIDLMLISASQIPYESARGESLEKVVDIALKNRDIKIAITAAKAIPYEAARGEALEKVLTEIIKIESEKEPNKSLKDAP